MQKLRVDEKIAIWFKHGELVNESFKANIKNTNKCYEIRAELFFFHAKNKCNTKVEMAVQKDAFDVKKRKRKRPALDMQNDLNDLNTQVMKTLQVLKETEKNASSVCSSAETTAIDFLRYWEEVHNFPKFKGANHTHEFQRFSFGEHSYLIPPQCQFYNFSIMDMNEIIADLNTYDLIVIDPPWRNKYIRRLKRHKQELAYDMLDNAELQRLPISKLICSHSIVVVWCTNAQQHQRALVEELLPAWNLHLLHTIKWMKINTSYELISDINNVGNKQPFEMLYLACHKESSNDFSRLKEVDHLFCIPSIVHSHKPPILKLLNEYLPENPQCLEFFARSLQPQFTCIGLEVLKLMDERLYKCIEL